MAASILFLNVSKSSHLFSLAIILFAFVNKCYCQVKEAPVIYGEEEPVKDFILCRACGADVVDAGYIINNLSPEASVLTNQTIFDSKDVSLQYLTNPFGVTFTTITVSTASCFGGNRNWYSEYSWYPGFAWKPCVCRHCGHLLGWIFEPIASASADRNFPSENGFYLLILDSLLSEKFANSLIVVPKLFRS